MSGLERTMNLTNTPSPQHNHPPGQINNDCPACASETTT